MTVKCLSTLQKSDVVFDFHSESRITELATNYNRSRRTIIRVLEEAGVDPGVKRRAPKPMPTKQAPLPLVIPTRTPWWKRITGMFGYGDNRSEYCS